MAKNPCTFCFQIISIHLRMNKIITGLLAYGMSGKVFHTPFLSANAGFKLQAVVERTSKKAAADLPEIISYNSIDTLLADKSIELVIVNTPNYLHFEHTKSALLAGKHVLVEKPFTASSAETEELFALADEKDLKVMVYQNRRYSSDFLATKKILESGKLGKLSEVHFRFDRYKPEIGPKAFKEAPFPASGIVYDLGAHLLDQAICLFGNPVRFFKTSGIFRRDGKVPDVGHIQLSYASGLQVFITLSYLVTEQQPGIIIHGEKGSFIKAFSDRQEEQSIAGMSPKNPQFGHELPGMEGNLITFEPDSQKQITRVPAEIGNMMGIFDAVYQTIRHDIPFPVTPNQIFTQIQILEASDNQAHAI